MGENWTLGIVKLLYHAKWYKNVATWSTKIIYVTIVFGQSGALLGMRLN